MKRMIAAILIAFFTFAPFGFTSTPSPANSILPLYTNDGKQIVCTAFVINTEKRYLMTADHCIAVVEQPMVKGVNAWEVGHYPMLDISILEAPAAYQLPALRVRPADAPLSYDEPITMYGFASGHTRLKVMDGKTIFPIITVANLPRIFTLYRPSAISGMSGGPVLDTNNRVVTIIMQGKDDADLSISTEMNQIYEATKEFWESNGQ